MELENLMGQITQGHDQKHIEGFRFHPQSSKKLLKALGKREKWSDTLYSCWELFLYSTSIDCLLDAKPDSGVALPKLTF